MEKQRNRSEIEEQYTWDLTTIYESDEKLYEELEVAKNEVKEVVSYKCKIVSSAKNLLDFLRYILHHLL